MKRGYDKKGIVAHLLNGIVFGFVIVLLFGIFLKTTKVSDSNVVATAHETIVPSKTTARATLGQEIEGTYRVEITEDAFSQIVAQLLELHTKEDEFIRQIDFQSMQEKGMATVAWNSGKLTTFIIAVDPDEAAFVLDRGSADDGKTIPTRYMKEVERVLHQALEVFSDSQDARLHKMVFEPQKLVGYFEL